NNGVLNYIIIVLFCFSSRIRHTRFSGDWSSDVCSSDLKITAETGEFILLMNTPFVKYADNEFSNIQIDVNSLRENQNAFIAIDTIDLKVYKAYNFVLNNAKSNDTLYVDTKFVGGTDANDQYSLNLFH